MRLIRSGLSLALIALLAAGAVHLQAGARERATQAAHPPLGQLITVGGVTVHAYVAGTGPDLVLIHGASANLRDFTFSLVPQLTDRYRVIAFDRPGLGYSDPLPDDSLSAQAALLQQAAAQLGADRPMVLGQSFGGAVALAWAVEHPEALSALITVAAPAYPWEGDLPRLYQALSHPVGQALLAPLITALVPAGYIDNAVDRAFAPQPAPAGYGAHFGPRLSARRVTLRRNAVQRRNLKDQIRAMAPRYGAITQPVEVLHGDADDVVSFSLHALQLMRDLPDAQLTRLPGIGHMPHHVSQPALITAIDRAATRAGLRP